MTTSSGKMKSRVLPCCRASLFTRPRVEFVTHDWTHRTKSIEPLGSSPLAVFILQIARSYIVHTCVTEDVWSHIFLRMQAATALSDDDSQLSFVVHAG